MRSRQLRLGLLTVFMASPAFASTVMVGTSDTRACYFATLNSATPAQLQPGLDTCTRAISANADDAYLHAALLVNRSDIRLRMADYSGAVADADASIALQPDLAAAYVNRGAGLIGLRRYREALPPLEKAISLNQGDKLQEAFFNRGLAREYLGDIQGAYRDYKKASGIRSEFRTRQGAIDSLHGYSISNKEHSDIITIMADCVAQDLRRRLGAARQSLQRPGRNKRTSRHRSRNQ